MIKKNNEILNIFTRSGISLSPRQLDQFSAFYDLLLTYNESLDLTRLKTFEDIIIKHFVDSVYFSKFIQLPSPSIDIGTGAGFPGIPLKILYPGLKLILAEPRKKRASFLGIAVRELNLSEIEIYPHMVTGKSFFAVNGVITRAVERIDNTLARVGHFLNKDGRVFFMKGPEADIDIRSISRNNLLSYALELDQWYTLPSTNYERRIIVYKKSSSVIKKTYSILKNMTATAGTAVTSSDNKKFKDLKRLLSGEGIRKSCRVLISGKKNIIEIMCKETLPATNLILFDGYVEDDDIMNGIISKMDDRGALIIMKKSLYNEVDLFNTRSPLLTAVAPEIKEWDLSVDPGCTLLIPFQDPANVGSVIRSAAGFNVKKIIILKEGAYPYHPKSIRASAGTVFSVTIMKGPALNELPGLLKDTASIVALDKSGTPLASFHFPERFLLLPGVEGPGLPEDCKGRSVSIPLAEGVESLNAPVAVSIALYEWNRLHSPSN